MGKQIDRLDRKAKYIARLHRALVTAGHSDLVLGTRNDWDDHIVAGDSSDSGDSSDRLDRHERRIVRCCPDTDDIYGTWSYRDPDGSRLADVIERDDDPGPAVTAVEKYFDGG